MEPTDQLGLSSFYNHPHQQPPTSTLSPPAAAVSPGPTATVSAPTNGLLPNHESTNATTLYPQSVAGKAPATSSEPAKRRRGRPRKYGTLEAAAAAKRASAALSAPPLKKKEQQPRGSHSSRKSQLNSLGNAGQSFMPHVISVASGEDVAHRILLFSQQAQREVCILSASGSICNVSLRQPSASGGSVTYEGQFAIVSLSGSYVREQGGRAGGLSACLASANGQIIGGCVGGPLTAAGPVEVILASFVMDPKKDTSTEVKGDTSATKLPSIVASPTPTAFYRPVVEQSARFLSEGCNDHQNMGGNPFMFQQQQDMHMTASHATDWRDDLDARSGINFNFAGRGGRESNESTENGNYEQLPH